MDILWIQAYLLCIIFLHIRVIVAFSRCFLETLFSINVNKFLNSDRYFESQSIEMLMA